MSWILVLPLIEEANIAKIRQIYMLVRNKRKHKGQSILGLWCTIFPVVFSYPCWSVVTSYLRGCPHIMSANFGGFHIPPPPLVSNRQHLLDPCVIITILLLKFIIIIITIAILIISITKSWRDQRWHTEDCLWAPMLCCHRRPQAALVHRSKLLSISSPSKDFFIWELLIFLL